MRKYETYRSAQEEFNAWQERQENLRQGRFKIFRDGEGKSKYHLDSEFVGKPISPEKLEEIFGSRERLLIQTYANQLAARNWYKFVVSHASDRFSREPNMMFFEIGELQKGERGVKIIYLGTGRTDKIPEIENEIAADSWGFATLNLKEESE